MLRLFTDGAKNCEKHICGWAYLLIDGDTVLLAESGTCRGSATDGEYLAVIYGLLALPMPVRVHIVTDREDIRDTIQDPTFGTLGKKKRKKRILERRQLIRQLGAPDEITVSAIKSGSHRWNRCADTLARRACGLLSKAQMRNRAKARSKQNDASLIP